MRYTKPCYYDRFRCIADRCPDNCCEGWQIMIDEQSLEKYRQVDGPFGNRLLGSIDWQEGSFRQNRGKCCFLNRDGLCDLQKELGEDYLCRTCMQYPRHVEEYDGLREWSLSLSCPEAARMILADPEPFCLLEEQTEEEEELSEEFEDFDLLLFSQLEEARAVMFNILREHKLSMEERIKRCGQLAYDMQACIDEERYYDVDGVIDVYRKPEFASERAEKPAGETAVEPECRETRYAGAISEFELLEGLERLRPEWSEVLQEAKEVLYRQGEEAYDALCEAFDQALGSFRSKWELAAENLMFFFLYTYFCGAVYDDWIYSKFELARFSVFWILELAMARWAVRGSLKEEDLVELAYRFAREIEHSDENLNALEEALA